MNTIKTIILLLVVAFPLFIQGQTTEQRKNNKFSIGISFSPDYSYHVLKTDASHQWLADLDNELFSPKLSYTSGLFLKYMVGKKFALESGIQFSDKGGKAVFSEDDFVDEFGNSVNDPAVPNKSTIVYHYQYIGVPLKLNYYFLQKRIKLFVSGGVSTDFFLSGKSKYVNEFKDRTEKGSYKMDDNFNKVNLVGLAGLGMETDISSCLVFRLEPTFRYSFTPVADAPLNEYLYSIGANIVLFYKY